MLPGRETTSALAPRPGYPTTGSWNPTRQPSKHSGLGPSIPARGASSGKTTVTLQAKCPVMGHDSRMPSRGLNPVLARAAPRAVTHANSGIAANPRLGWLA